MISGGCCAPCCALLRALLGIHESALSVRPFFYVTPQRLLSLLRKTVAINRPNPCWLGSQGRVDAACRARARIGSRVLCFASILQTGSRAELCAPGGPR